MWPTEDSHLLLAEHALPDAGKRETHLCRVLPFFCFYNTALHLRRDLWSTSAGFGRFSLSASSWCVRWPRQAPQPAEHGRRAGGSNHSATSRVGPFQPGHRFGAHRHRLQLSSPMRGTRASAHTALRMRRAAKLASIQGVMTKERTTERGAARASPAVNRYIWAVISRAVRQICTLMLYSETTAFHSHAASIFWAPAPARRRGPGQIRWIAYTCARPRPTPLC